jgi:hypothetical protein
MIMSPLNDVNDGNIRSVEKQSANDPGIESQHMKNASFILWKQQCSLE